MDVLINEKQKAAEANISLGNVSYSHHSEAYFHQAVRYLQQASEVRGYTLGAYLQRYVVYCTFPL